MIEARADEFLALMTGPRAVFYFCGLKRMYTSVMDTLEALGKARRPPTHPCVCVALPCARVPEPAGSRPWGA